MKTEIVVWIPFNFDDRKRKDKPGFRYAATLAKQEWWDKRTPICRDYTLCSLAYQTDKEFNVWGVFRAEDMSRAKNMMQVFADYEFETVVDTRPEDERGPTELRLEPIKELIETFRGRCDRLILVRLDSDDMYHVKMIEELRKLDATNEAGAVYYVGDGYAFDARERKVYTWLARGCPPAFFAMSYAAEALSSREVFYAYRRKHGFECFHHQLLKTAKHKVFMGRNSYCIVLHGANTTDDWGDPAMMKHIGAEILGEADQAEFKDKFGGEL